MTPVPVQVRRRIIARYDRGKTTDAIEPLTLTDRLGCFARCG